MYFLPAAPNSQATYQRVASWICGKKGLNSCITSSTMIRMMKEMGVKRVIPLSASVAS